MTSKLRVILEAYDNTKKGFSSAEEGAEGLKKGLDVLKGSMIAGGVIAAGKVAFELGQLGAQSLRTKASFVAISSSASNAEQNLNAMRAATRGAMSEQEMMANANQFLQMGIATTSDELGSMTEMAVRLGGAMGTNATDALSNFTAMMANQSIPRLDTFGISSGKVKTRITELMAATEGLTREQAFNMAVMEEGTSAMNRLGDAVEDEALAFEQAEATMADAKAMLAEKLAPAVAAVTSQLALGVKELTQWGTRIKQVAGGAAAFGLHLLGADEKARDMLEGMGLINEKTLDLTETMAMAAQVTDSWATSMAAGASEEVVLTMLDVGEATSIYSDALQEAGLSTSQVDQQTQMFAQTLGTTLTAEQQLQADAQLLNQAYRAGAIDLAALNIGLQSAASGTLQLSDAERQNIEAEIRSTGAAKELARAHEEAAKAAAGQAGTTMDLAKSLKDATSSQIANQLTGMLDPEKMGATAYTEAVTNIGLSFGTMDEKSIALSQNMGLLAESIESGVIPAEDADEALQALIADAEDGEVAFDALVAQFEGAPQPIDATGESARRTAHEIDGTGQSFGTAAPKLDAFNDGLTITDDKLMALVAGSPYNISVNASGNAGGPVPRPGGPQPYQLGTSFVPDTGLALLHRGEMVIPPAQAQQIRAGAPLVDGAGRGGDIIYNVTINDQWTGAVLLDQMRRDEESDILSRI